MLTGTVGDGCYGDALTSLVVDAHAVQRFGLLRGGQTAIIADPERGCMPLDLR